MGNYDTLTSLVLTALKVFGEEWFSAIQVLSSSDFDLGEDATIAAVGCLLTSATRISGRGWKLKKKRITGGFRRYRVVFNDVPARPEPAPAPTPAPTPEPTPADPVEVRRTALEESQAKRERNALADRVRLLEAQLDSVARPNSQPLPAINVHRAAAGKRPGTAVALLSDVHAGELVSRTSAVDNYYSPGVCRIRLERYFAGVAWLIDNNRSWADIQDLVLWFGGDMVTGHIHDELAETSQSTIETIEWLEPLLVAGVQMLQREAGVNVQLVCSYGNHGRDTKKMRNSTGAEHSHEWGMYQRLARQLPGVNVLADRGAHQYINVYGKTFHFHHGHEIKYGGGVGGIMIPGNKAVAMWDRVRVADVHHFGHYHQYLDAGRVVFNGSLKGYDSFAMSIKAAPEIAQQAFYVYDAKRGRTACSPVWVVDSEAEAELERRGE